MPNAGDLVGLLIAVALGDERAFERLYEATRAKIYGVILRIVRRPDLAEPVLLDTFTQIWRNAVEFDPRDASPLTWMVALARARALDAVRKPNGKGAADASDNETEAAHFARDQMTEDLKRLLGCLSALPTEQRRLILLAYYTGWNRERLAARVEEPVTTVKTWIRRGLVDIRECLGHD